ncbi:MAG: porin [Vibrio sp.]
MKTFYKTLLATAVVSTSFASLAADLPITVYGKLNVSAQSNDDDVDDETRIQSNASRLGVKGEHELKPNLDAFYVAEYELSTDTADGDDDFKARNIYAGLKGDTWGQVMIGRNDTYLKNSQGKIDQFNDLSGDLKNLFKGDNRQDQTLTYLTPSWNNFQAGVTYIASDDDDQKDAYADYGMDGKDGVSTGVSYGDSGLKATPIYAAVAYDSQVKGYDTLRASLQGKIGDLKLGGIYQNQEKSEGDSEDINGYLLSAAYQIQAVTLKAQWQDMEDLGDSWSVGADYKLADPTKLYAFYTARTMEDDLDVLDDMGVVTGVKDRDETYFGVGIEHKFSM